MVQGGTIHITPSWVNSRIPIDITWDPTLLSLSPRGDWWGVLALLGRTGTDKGEWDWDQSDRKLFLWVVVPGSGHRRLVAAMSQFDMPPVKGASGTGSLQPGMVPTTQPVPFDWVVG